MKVEVAEIDAEGRLLLPNSVRENFNLKASDKLRICFDENAIQLEPAHLAAL